MSTNATPRLRFWTKIIYGSGEWSIASFGTLRQIFYAIFLVDVVGLEPRLASFAALAGVIWDAINDPIVGTLSDRMKSRWGRRRPFLLFFTIPFALGFVALWYAPPFESQITLMLYCMFAYMLSDTLQTLVVVPYYSLMPEVAPEYDQRTSVTGYRMVFNLLASLAVAVLGPMIVKSTLSAGFTQQQGYLITAALFGGLATIPLFLIFATVRERFAGEAEKDREVPFRQTARTAWANIPFRFATLLYMLNWITFDLVGLMLPFFLTYWIAQGNLTAKVNILGEPFTLESAVLGLLLITAIVAVPFWTWLARKLDKRRAYIIGMSFWVVVQLLIFSTQPEHVEVILLLGVLTAHVLPDAIVPDVIEWDELRTGRRQEGVYYGIKNFVRKLTGAFAIFFALQVLGWFGYQAPPDGVTQFAQSAATQQAIRYLTGPIGALMLIGAITVAYFYPLTRERHERILRLLEKRRAREASRFPSP
jgi:GPH family glycoside/pentoside/hexuronide:cation symporter